MVRRHGVSIQEEIVGRRVTEFVKVWKSREDLPRVIGWGLCDLSSRRIRWGLCVLGFKYLAAPTRRMTVIEVGTGLQNHRLHQATGPISSTLSFPHSCVDELDSYCLKTLTEDSQFPQFNFFSLFVFILCYPVFTLSVLCACLHFIMMTMSVSCYAYFWVLIPLQVVLR